MTREGRTASVRRCRCRCVSWQVKKQQQAVVGFLEANGIHFQQVDIAMLEEQRLWMYRHIPRDKRPPNGNPLPPQIFNDDVYCGVGWRSTLTTLHLFPSQMPIAI